MLMYKHLVAPPPELPKYDSQAPSELIAAMLSKRPVTDQLQGNARSVCCLSISCLSDHFLRPHSDESTSFTTRGIYQHPVLEDA